MCDNIDDMERRETQRRHDASEEYSNVLPPDVVSILTEADQSEHSNCLTHTASHRKLTEVRQLCFNHKLLLIDVLYSDVF